MYHRALLKFAPVVLVAAAALEVEVAASQCVPYTN
jgi:hypothetical protein